MYPIALIDQVADDPTAYRHLLRVNLCGVRQARVVADLTDPSWALPAFPPMAGALPKRGPPFLHRGALFFSLDLC